jgi:hypothetical protein
LRATPIPISRANEIVGAGVYAIYYVGPFEAYRLIASVNRDGKFEKPIYVGKAIPKGSRKGGLASNSATGTALADRLKKHTITIAEATNLEVSDFHIRHLVIDDIWIPLGENVLIESFQPLWNVVIDGFGNNDPGKRRATQFRSLWDTLHPGRSFAEKLADNPTTIAELTKRIADAQAGRQVPTVNERDTSEDEDE